MVVVPAFGTKNEPVKEIGKVFVLVDDNQAIIKKNVNLDVKKVAENIEQKLVDISFDHDTNDVVIDIVNL